MGIRKSLEQSIEHEDLNLKDFVMPEEKEETGFDFDLDKEVTKDDWEEIKNELRRIFKTEGGVYCLEILSGCFVVAPEMKSKFILEPKERTIRIEIIGYRGKSFLDLLEGFGLDSDNINFNLIEFCKSLDQVLRAAPVDIKLGWQKCRYTIEHFFLVHEINFPMVNITDLLKSIAMLRLIFEEEMKNDSLLKRIANVCLEEMKKRRYYYSLIELMSAYKIAFPEKAKDLKVDWDKVEQAVNVLRDDKFLGNWGRFLHGKASMKVLAAKEVSLTKNGLELVMPERKFKPEIFIRPERRE